jgi:hypothetical protein
MNQENKVPCLTCIIEEEKMNSIAPTPIEKPTQQTQHPEQSIEQVGSMVKITEKIGKGSDVIGIDALVQEGSISFYMTYSLDSDPMRRSSLKYER